MVLLQSRGALSSTRDALTQADAATRAADQRCADIETELAAERQKLEAMASEVDRLESDVVDARSSGEEQRAELEAQLQRCVDLEEELAAAEAAKNELTSTVAEHTASIEQLTNELAAAVAASAELDEQNLGLSHDNEALQVRLIEVEDEAARRRDPSVPSVLITDDGSGLDVPGFSPGMAWELELVRSERTWRYSVSANPVDDPDPFESADNPLKLAIEIEALALREDVGAFIGIDWRAGSEIDPAIDPARAHLTLRLAQELLASAARELSPSTLVVRPDPDRGGLSLEVVASNPDDVDFKIPPPPIASEWIDIDEHGGLVVTVKLDESATGPIGGS